MPLNHDDPNPHFKVIPFKRGDPKQLIDILRYPDSLDNWHCIYLLDYLNSDSVAVKTIIVENDYRDHDFLSDHAAYYVRCFYPYPKHCKRLHFFSFDFTQARFAEMIARGGKDDGFIRDIQANYAGFMVVKPLPDSFIGRTCLKTYEETPENGRHYPILRDYRVSLFGLDLTVKSLAFQEQDKVVAACATSALWSTLQGTGILFQHSIPSPVEITEIAGQCWSGYRVFPNAEGLTTPQMTYALQRHGMQPIDLKAQNLSEFLAFVYAYLQCALPIIQNIRLFTKNAPDDCFAFEGCHSVVITGFNLRRNPSELAKLFLEKAKRGEYCLLSSAINKIYVHDDNIGPFTRIHMIGSDAQSGECTICYRKENAVAASDSPPVPEDFPYIFKYGVYDDTHDQGKPEMHGTPLSAIIPLHGKMRISLPVISKICRSFHHYYCKTAISYYMELDNNLAEYHRILYWDIYLTSVNKYKADFFTGRNIPSGRLKLDILSKSLPRFLWVAKAYGINNDKEHCLIELIFDATDVESENIISLFIVEKSLIKETLEYAARKIPLPQNLDKFFHLWFDKEKQEHKEILVTTCETASELMYTESMNEPADETDSRRQKTSSLRTVAEPVSPSSELMQFRYDVHHRVTYGAVGAILNAEIATITAKANADVDGGVFDSMKWLAYQTEDKLYIHHMRQRHETSEAAKNRSYEVFSTALKKACFHLRTDRHSSAHYLLGVAMHTLQDSFAHSDTAGNPITTGEHLKHLWSYDDLCNERNAPKQNALLDSMNCLLHRYKSVLNSDVSGKYASGNREIAAECATCGFWNNHLLFGMPQLSPATECCCLQ